MAAFVPAAALPTRRLPPTRATTAAPAAGAARRRLPLPGRRAAGRAATVAMTSTNPPPSDAPAPAAADDASPSSGAATSAAAAPPAAAADSRVAPTMVRVRRALLSVSDKTSLVGMATYLSENGVELLSTGGTAAALRAAGLPVVDVADYTGFPEMLDGRVKTLHPKVHGGLLGIRDSADHVDAMAAADILPIDLVIVNLYPFGKTVARGAPWAECVENVDIGGPAMVRAAAKNHAHVTVVTDVSQYAAVLNELADNDCATGSRLRLRLAAEAYGAMAAYDAAVARRFHQQAGTAFPPVVTWAGALKQTLRYGENPHQAAAFYADASGGGGARGVASAEQIQGKELSYNNISDTDAAWALAAEFDPATDGPAAVVVKHANPCGVAVGDSAAAAFTRALACDPLSAFGGIIALNVAVDKAAAEAIAGLFAEVLIAPDVSAAAAEVLAKKKNLRVLLTGGLPPRGGGGGGGGAAAAGVCLKSVSGGYLLQGADTAVATADSVRVVTKRAPTDAEMRDLLFANRIVKHVKSNAILFARDGRAVGTGAGQMSRVDAARIAAWKAAETGRAAGEAEGARTAGSVVASDAFFPFPDGLVAVADAGATAVIQPGGSKRDAEVIAAADERGMAMVFCDFRTFKH